MKREFLYVAVSQFLLTFIVVLINIYLLRIISIDIYGRYIFFQSLFSFFSVFINSGVANDSLRDLSLAYIRGDVNDKFSEYISIKFFYMVIAFLICFLLGFFKNFNSVLFLFMTFFLFFYFFDFMVVYQSIKKTKLYMCVCLMSFSVSFILLFLFVKKNQDIIYVPMVISFPFCIFNVFVLLNFTELKMCFSYAKMITRLKKNSSVMFSSVVSALFSKSIYLLIGIFVGDRGVALFSVVDQITRAPLIFINRISTLFTHRIIEEMNSNNSLALRGYFSKCFLLIFFVSICCALFLAGMSQYILDFLLKDGWGTEEREMLFLMLLCIPLISLSSLCAVQYHLNSGNTYLIIRYGIFLALIACPVSIFSVYYGGVMGMVIAYVSIEFCVMLYFIYYLRFNLFKVIFNVFFYREK